MSDIIINPPQQYLHSKMSGFSIDSCCIDKTKSMDVFKTKSMDVFQTHVNTLANTIQNIFLREFFINLDRYYYKPATTVFILKNVWF